jgi:hypothetical protein
LASGLKKKTEIQLLNINARIRLPDIRVRRMNDPIPNLILLTKLVGDSDVVGKLKASAEFLGTQFAIAQPR